MPKEKITITAELTGLNIIEAPVDHQIIAILTKKLGGEVLINLDNEIQQIKGFAMSVTPHGNILIRTNK